MKIKKIINTTLVTSLFLGTLVGCSKNKSSSGDLETLNGYYEEDINNMDYLVDNKEINAVHVSNGLEGLFESDPQKNIRGGMATSWKVSKDGLTYMYYIRENVPWIQADGSEYAKVKPTDFVTGMKHAVDSKSSYMYLVDKSIKGLDKYISGEDKDFTHVGIKADDKNMTVSYTLNQPEPYWNSKLLSGIFYPLNADFLKSKGKLFGKVAIDSILYNGPFILTQITNKSVIKMKANDSYWDKKNVHLKNINLTYDDKKDPALQQKSFFKGGASQALIKSTDANFEKILEKQKNNLVYGNQGVDTYFAQFNFDRKSYKNTIDGKDEEGTRKAILNHDFRAAIGFAFNKAEFNAQTFGKVGGRKSVRNSFIPSGFVKLDGKDYVSVLQKELNALDSNWKKVNVEHDGNNTAYNPELAKQYFEKAKVDLTAKGVKFPIHLDWIEIDVLNKVNSAKALKHSIESLLGQDNVVIDLHIFSKEKFFGFTYLAETPETLDWDFCSPAGWTPDIIDPSGYLDVFGSRSGNMVYLLGIQPSETTEGEYYSGPIVKQIGLLTYDKLLDQASKITLSDQLNERYKLFAKAEAQLLNERLIIPLRSEIYQQFTKVKPYSWASGMCGSSYYKDIRYPFWKYVELQEHPVTVKQFQEAEKEFDKQAKKAKVLDEKK
ncbi:MAG: ABC transporter substrate-binding protein [Lactobacillales bacterium]|jgi:oligopeptide transport system substrate-binding protein|nr:ABC transporter substrate-binding protein [Lactobacillales bacterium]